MAYSTTLRSGNANINLVASSATSVTLLAASIARLGASIYNDSTAVLYISFDGAAVIATNFSIQVASEGYVEVPFGYTGTIHGIWASANGQAFVTEFS
jgi:hypothetical protein